MRRLTDTTLPILLAASLFAVSGGAYAGDDCSNSSIEEDDYWTVLDGTAFVLSPLTSLNIPITSSGLLKYDGEGGCEFSGTVNIGGAITQVDAADSCTYSVIFSGWSSIRPTFRFISAGQNDGIS